MPGNAAIGARFARICDRLSAVAAVLRSEDELLPGQVEIAVGPPVVSAALELHQLLCRLVRALLGRIELRPVLPELVTTVLSRKDPTGGVERNALSVAQACRKALGERELLPCPVGVVAPGAGSRHELGAWLDAGGVLHAVLDLAGVGGRAQIDVQGTLRLSEGHGVVPGQRQLKR